MATGKRLLLLAALLSLLLSGCGTRPVAVAPSAALQAALQHPEVAAWHASHSAPAVLAGLGPTAVRGLGQYRPVVMVDLVRDGLLVRLDSALGAAPRRVEVTVSRASGEVLAVKMR